MVALSTVGPNGSFEIDNRVAQFRLRRTLRVTAGVRVVGTGKVLCVSS